MNQEELRVLQRPFNNSDIKSRQGRNGGSFSYIEGHQVILRLNEAFGGNWGFRVMEHQVLEGEVIVLGELRCGDLVKQSFGGSEVTRTRDGKVVSIADDLKAASTDALKKSATMLGVGLHLYGPDEHAGPVAPPRLVPAMPEKDIPVEEPDAGGSVAGVRLTRKQADYIAKLAKQNGLSKAEVEALSSSKFGRQSAYLSVQQASDFIQLLSASAA